MDEMKDLETDLDIELYGLNEQEAMNPDYPVKNEEDAEFVLGQIIRLQKEMEPIGAERDAKINKIIAWYEYKTKQKEDEINRRKAQLMLYADTQLALSRKKSFVLPSGRVGFRAVGPKFEKDDEQLLIYAKQYDSKFVKVKEEVDWSGLKKKLVVDGMNMVNPDTGEVVPGVTVYKQPKKFYLEVF